MKKLDLKTGREISSGGVIYKKDEKQAKIALIHRKDRNVWCLPKGKIEKKESPEQAAIREVREETGLEGEVEKKIGDIRYVYIAKDRGLKIFKVVSFYLLRHAGGSFNSHDREVDDCKWFPLDNAPGVMSYKSEKEIVEKAKRML